MAWLHVPTSITSACAAAPAESTSPSSWPWASRYEPFVTSSGTLVRRPLSWPGWETRPWIRLLCGIALRPSTARRGVASWISSLQATRASHSAQPASAVVSAILDTCGPTFVGSLLRRALSWSSWRTSQGTSNLGLTPCAATWRPWATLWRRDWSLRQKSARLTRGNVSSRWVTGPVPGGPGYGEPGPVGFGDLWPTPLSSARRVRTFTGKRFLPEAVCWFVQRFHLAPVTLRNGLPSCDELPICNPLFVEYLMGWPTYWTDCDCAVTGWFPWLRRMRSLLSSHVCS